MALDWIISQIGAREHYAVARAFHRRGQLRLLYTEAWSRRANNLLRRGPRAARAFATRRHPDIPSNKVHAFTFSTLRQEFMRRVRSKNAGVDEAFRTHATIGRDFATRVARHLAQQKLDPKRDAFFGYNTGCLETLDLLEQRGVLRVVDQIDPARVEEQMVADESQRWPGWEKAPGRIPEEYWQRLEEEWRRASLVLVNSDWSKQALTQQGVAASKIIVVPLAYEGDRLAPASPGSSESAGRPLTVLWVGSVILRKGIQYLIEAARLLKDHNIRFVIAGPVQISDAAVKSAPASVEFIGRVTRDRLGETYRRADVFVLPTISDGFAITQIEAMSCGLPVIATPNCGRVVTHGEDGLIVPARDAAALAAAVAELERDRGRLPEMSRRAIQKSQQFSLNHFADRLQDGVARFLKSGAVE